ncbi:MAG TPA: hypothetical protein DCL21_01035, partial [Alphaproteobacteria bacterium]|nr:hypothetical protein [Alphaproteobacteria bacterium]
MKFTSAKAQTKQHKPVLFLHGAYCDSFVWEEHYINYFSEKGFDCYSLDFESEESLFSLNPTTVNTYVNQVLECIKQIGEPPIIVAHSMGAAVIQKLYSKYKIEFPAWVLMTPTPPRGYHISSQMMMLSDPTLFNQMYMLQMLGKNFVDPGLAKHVLFADDFDEKKAESYLPMIKSMPHSLVYDVMTMVLCDQDLKVDFPVMLQAAESDKLITRTDVETVEKTYDIKATYYDSGHAIMLDKSWKTAADDVIVFLEEKA